MTFSMAWRSRLEPLPYKKKVGCLKPSCDSPKSFFKEIGSPTAKRSRTDMNVIVPWI